MKDRFYYRSGRQIRGPVKFAVIVALLRQGVLSLDDSVRPQGRQDWIRIENVVGSLLLQYPEIDRSTPRSMPSASVAERAAAASRQTHVRTGAPSQLVVSVCSALVGKLSDVSLSGLGASTEVLRCISARHASVMLAVCIMIGLNLAVICGTPSEYQQEASILQELNLRWAELRDLRTRDATDEEWAVFQQRVAAESAHMADQLAGLASTDNRVAMRLLWAARTNLPAMLTDSRNQPSANERLFLSHLRQAERLLREGGKIN